MVYGLDMDGKPLMPTQRHDKVRHLLKERKAKVVKKNRVLRKHRFIH
ncbi:RRXRR domain-containing protein [Erysipelotrichaceae bacterium RD49]|nr:RRXRR domain-containing protein [Erysipelotrichaceae bacterium RD49]